jgi:tetratricopeptide (TPR) repeat protein
LNELLKDNLQNANAYFYKGLIYKESGDTAKAVSSFQTCTEVDPDYYDAWMQLGLLYAAKGDPLAIRYYDNAIAVSDSSQEAEYAKAKFFQDVGNITDAIEYYRRLIVKDPQDADALYNLATIYFGVDSLDKAYRFFDLAIKQSPGKAYAHYGKGLCAEKMGKKEEALAYFKQAIALDPQLTFIEEKIQALNAE